MIAGGLFTREFLLDGVVGESAWRSLDAERVATAWAEVGRRLSALARQRNPNEAETEQDLIYPVLEAIGWRHQLPQQNMSTTGRSDVPDALLFVDEGRLEQARVEMAWQRFKFGDCVVEAKRWQRPLDRPSERAADPGELGVPSTQMLRYMRRADDITQGRLRWGMLTNGRLWRLYWQGAVHAAENYIEIDLGKVFGLPGCDPDLLDPRDLTADHAFRLFILLFGPEAFVPAEQGRTFHDVALLTGKRWEERVARDLSRVVFSDVFPVLTKALGRTDPARPEDPDAAWLEDVRQGALILLYRLLFVLYAEDRNLLPDENGPYQPYALTRIRQEVAQKRSDGRPESPRAAIYWARLTTIFNAIADGDDDLGVPPYNGGLFDPATAPILARTTLPDEVVAEVVFRLSHVDSPQGPKYVNYRDLSVQQLGSIYERILEFGLKVVDGEVAIDADADERHDSGSFYTPDALVGLIIAKTVGPAVDERLATFRAEAARLRSDTRPVAARLADLARSDPAAALLDLKICDPAMGSGHFLVSLVEWLAVQVLDAMAEAAALVDWGDYASPLSARIAHIRTRILAEATQHRWPIVTEQLDDPKIVRRMILKRVVYGVDKNPMAVELAKVALWLHTFTVGAPLSFLDHHLRVGDSLIGAWVRPVVDAVEAAGGSLARGEIVKIENIAAAMTQIEEMTDNDVAEVRASKATFGVVEEATHDLDAFFSLMTARAMLDVIVPPPTAPRHSPDTLRAAGLAEPRRIALAERQQAAHDRGAAFASILAGQYGEPLKVARGEGQFAPADESDQPLLAPMGDAARIERRAASIVDDAAELAARERFLHWPIAFPNLWRRLDQPRPVGGFDAVIGNPPYVRQEKLSAAVKSALQAGYAVHAGTADLYVYFFEQGLKLVKPGGRVGYVVNNKWLKAGYAEGLRALLADPAQAETETVIDFGHARGFFPDADVFPNVTVVRRPDGRVAAETVTVSVPARDTLPDDRLAGAVDAASFPLARAVFSREGWTLEPQPVLDLLAKIRGVGRPLEQVVGAKPAMGIKTGFNPAFLIDTETRNRLLAADPASADVIRPYMRGQDIERWASPNTGLHMVLLKSSNDFPWPWAAQPSEGAAEAVFATTYPALHAHMKRYESFTDAGSTKRKGLRHREDHGRFWWELRPCAYYDLFDAQKIFYQEIQFYPSYALDRAGQLGNNKTYFIPGGDARLLAVLNSPLLWWHNWRFLPHMKDEALSPMAFLVERMPIVLPPDTARADAERLVAIAASRTETSNAISDWLRHEFGLERSSRTLEAPERLDADAFVAAVRAALPRREALSAAKIARLKREHAETVEPARRAAAEAAQLERRLSDQVNAAYGLTPDEVALMWRTAPPRMPSVQPAASVGPGGEAE